MRRRSGLALPTALFFVLVLFFTATAVVVRARYQARASLLETSRIQKEAFARAVATTALARLNQAGSESGLTVATLEDPQSGLSGRAWLEPHGDDVFHLIGEASGKVGEPARVQMVVRKRPVLEGLDYAHLNDDQIATSDEIRFRVKNSNNWADLDSPSMNMLWVEADLYGNLFGLHMPALEDGFEDPVVTRDWLDKLVAANDEMARQGKFNSGFWVMVARGLERNETFAVGAVPSEAVNPNAGQGPGGGALPPSQNPGGALPNYGGNNGVQGPTISAVEFSQRITAGAEVARYADGSGWATIEVPVTSQQKTEGFFPGRANSDGDRVFLPLIGRGPDKILQHNLDEGTWSEVPSPPNLQFDPNAPAILGVPPVVSTAGPAESILEVVPDGAGGVFARHGTVNQLRPALGISHYDAASGQWQTLPPPPGLTRGADGEVKQLLAVASPEAVTGLESGSDGSLYVLWRASLDPLLNGGGFFPGGGAIPGNAGNTGPGSSGGNTGSGNPGNTGLPLNTGLPVNSGQVTAGNAGGFAVNTGQNGAAGNAGSAGVLQPGGAAGGFQPIPGGILPGGSFPPAPLPGGPSPGGVLPGGPLPGRPQPGGPFPGGPFPKPNLYPDTVLVYRDGAWSPVPAETSGFYYTAGIDVGEGDEVTLLEARPGSDPDLVHTWRGQQQLPPFKVPLQYGGAAEYFGFTTGARPIPDRFVFETLAEF